jgi:F-type H+-transporting ATPase subunit a
MIEAESPLSQFEVRPIHFLPPLHLGPYDVSFTNASLLMLIVVGTVLLFLAGGARRGALVPGRWQSMAESTYLFVEHMIRDTIGDNGRQYFPIVFSIFLFVLFANLFGMLPYSFTVTSHIIVTFAMAIVIFIGVTIIGFARHGLDYFHLFLPSGTPWIMAPLLFFIELFSYLARPVSLSIRLAANMMAGHTMLKVIGGFVIALGILGGWLPFALLVVLNGFEIFVALLQAYIFTILTCVYLNDAVNMH